MTDTEREFLKAVDGDTGRLNCPPMNIGRKFGAIGDGLLEGFIDNPSYCIVRDGRCSRHSPVSRADLLDAVATIKAATSCATCKMPFEVRWVPTCQCS